MGDAALVDTDGPAPAGLSTNSAGDASDLALQKMGYLAQVPAGYDEYYVPAAERKYKQPAE